MQKSKLQEFKQLSFETFVLLKQKLNDSRKSIQEKPQIATTPTTEYSELQECDCDGSSFVTVQQFKKRKILTGLFEQTAVLLV